MNILYLIVALIFGSGVGIGMAFLICASMLKKSNDIGDSVGDAKEYTEGAVFTVQTKRLSYSEREGFSDRNEIPIRLLYEEPSDNDEVRKIRKIG